MHVCQDLFEDTIFDEEYFPALRKISGISERCEGYMEKLRALIEEFERRFVDFKTIKDELAAFSSPLLTDAPVQLRSI